MWAPESTCTLYTCVHLGVSYVSWKTGVASVSLCLEGIFWIVRLKIKDVWHAKFNLEFWGAPLNQAVTSSPSVGDQN